MSNKDEREYLERYKIDHPNWNPQKCFLCNTIFKGNFSKHVKRNQQVCGQSWNYTLAEWMLKGRGTTITNDVNSVINWDSSSGKESVQTNDPFMNDDDGGGFDTNLFHDSGVDDEELELETSSGSTHTMLKNNNNNNNNNNNKNNNNNITTMLHDQIDNNTNAVSIRFEGLRLFEDDEAPADEMAPTPKEMQISENSDHFIHYLESIRQNDVNFEMDECNVERDESSRIEQNKTQLNGNRIEYQTAKTAQQETNNYKTWRPQDEHDPINYELFDKFLNEVNKGRLHSGYSLAEIHWVRLLSMLEKAKAPTYLFDQIVDWASDASLDKIFNVADKIPKRDNLLDRLRERHGFSGYVPVETVHKLPFSQSKVKMTTFDFEGALYSLLTDRSLMRRENLLFFDMDDPFSGPTYPDGIDRNEVWDSFPEEHVFENLLSGRVARAVWRMNAKIEGKQIPILVIFFCDGTHLDKNDRNHLEPLSFTLSIFNDEVRQRREAWRVLAYIPNRALYQEHSNTAQKNGDYQYLMKQGLQSFIDFQKKGGVYWEVPNYYRDGGKLQLEIKLYYGLMTGDTQGHDKMVGKKSVGSIGPKVDQSKVYPCRRCSITFQNMDNWDFGIQLNTKAKLKSKDKTTPESADKIGFYTIKKNGQDRHKVALDLCDSGWRNTGERKKNDVHAITAVMFSPQDNLHGNYKGLMERSVDNFRESRLHPKMASSNNKYVFSTSNKAFVEAAMDVWGIVLQNQSQRIGLRTHFIAGAMSTEKVTAGEIPGLVLLYLIFVSSTCGEYLLGSPPNNADRSVDWTRRSLMGDDKIVEWATSFDDLLLADAFRRSKDVTEAEMKLYERYLPVYMDHIFFAMERVSGNGDKFPKAHGQMHYPMDHRNYGPAMNFDGMCGEENHKYWGKDQHNKTQKRSSVLEIQISKHTSIGCLLHVADKELNMTFSKKTLDEETCHKYGIFGCDYVYHKGGVPKIDDASWQGELSGVQNLIEKEGFYKYSPRRVPDDNGKMRQVLGGEKADWSNQLPLENKLKAFLKRVLAKSKWNQFKLRNSYRDANGVLYHAQPGLVTQTGYKNGWNDWAYLNMGQREDGSEKVFPCHLIAFVEINGLSEEGFVDPKTGCEVKESGCYVVCHAMSERYKDSAVHREVIAGSDEEELNEQCCQLMRSFTKQYEGDLAHNAHNRIVHYIYSVHRIRSPCICVPDIIPKSKPNRTGAQQDFMVDTEVNVSLVEYILIPPPTQWKKLFVEKMNHYVNTTLSEEEERDLRQERIERRRARRESNEMNHRLFLQRTTEGEKTKNTGKDKANKRKSSSSKSSNTRKKRTI